MVIKQLILKKATRMACMTLFILLSGCVNYLGIRNKQILIKPDNIPTPKSLPQEHGKWPDFAWANQFGDPQLVALINEAVANNPDLQIAQARLSKAQAQVDGKSAILLPSLTGMGSVGRQRLSGNLFPPPLGSTWYTQGLTALNLVYDLDLWGKNLSALSQALSEERAAQASQQQSKLMIASMVATAYSQLAFQYDLRDVLQRTVAQRKALNNITKIRINNGLDTNVQLYQSRNLEAAAKTQLVEAEGQIIVVRQQLGTLLGNSPDRGLSIKRPKFKRLEAPRLPDQLPLRLLGRRPDITAARWQVEAALHGVKSTKAKFYPNVNLIATAGFLSLGLSRLFEPTSQNIVALPVISLPIFDAGSLRAQLRGQYAAFDEAVGTYNSTVTNAVGDVAKQIVLIRTVDSELNAQKEALYTSQQAYKLAIIQYRLGLASQLVVLDAETRYLADQQTRLALVRSRRDLQIALIKALGGGFSEKCLVTPRTTATPHRVLHKEIHV